MDPSVLANMDKDALKKQIENMKYQASMERWPLSKSIAAFLMGSSHKPRFQKSAVLKDLVFSAPILLLGSSHQL
ncbi:guanine nucleotide-binding protein subunit gamma-e isoform X1 [Andrena cerasifolii]|uniref:guanine nucleotide-binding protein subunit gamma-e isoform X1 n=1 Tax=Andrena cerasifolii TaxID=2819439 RepID=UPI004037AF1C